MPTHKPRKRQTKVSEETNDTKAPDNQDEPQFPLQAFLWSIQGGVSRWVVLPLILIICGLYRWTAGFWPYSGFQTPPMHGDFEAQRHWMEITLHLPITEWYFHDLEWWGLDYPPLTAYHSWLLGHIGSSVDPAWFALHTSRGLDDVLLKTFMRATVLVSEYLIYVPAIVFFVRRLTQLNRTSQWEGSMALLAILLQPGIILIDHAHFQYNTVMLGLVTASLSSILADKLAWACVFFVGALGFKQMALYYAPVIFAYLLGACLTPRLRLGRLSQITVVTGLSFVSLVLPLIFGTLWRQYRQPSMEQPEPPLLQGMHLDQKAVYYPVALQMSQVVHRMFPFARGLFEDKVANFWCALHTFYKLRTFPASLLQPLSLCTTAMSIAGPCILIGAYPRRKSLPLAAATAAWGFFLFSFQVHEKSVLLPLLPMTLLLADEQGLLLENRAWISWANILACWTMFPLLKRDRLRVPYFVLTLLWAWLMGEPSVFYISWRDRDGTLRVSSILPSLLHCSFYISMIVWHVLEACLSPPEGKPDFWVVLNVIIGAMGFGICYLWCSISLLRSCTQQMPLHLPSKDGLREEKTKKA